VRLTPDEIDELRAAKAILENRGIASRLTNLIGSPVDMGFDLLPDNWKARIGDAAHKALVVALRAALSTLKPEAKDVYPRWHKAAATLAGGIGGAFGLPALIVELPVSTTIMLRSIAEIARWHGEVLSTPESHIACLEVFAFGAPSRQDGTPELGYFAVRSTLARAVSEASQYLVGKAAIDETAPAIVRLIAVIAARFQVQVSQKAAAMVIPVAGVIGGGGINLLFIDHFQSISRSHFTVRRLERRYDPRVVREGYEAL
jgi:hypothetical protein